MARYFRRGTTKIWYVPAISAPISAPDEDEFTVAAVGSTPGAVDLTCAVAEISGFSFQNNPIDVPDMCATFVKKIPGEDTADDSEITFYEENSGNPLIDAASGAMRKGQTGYIVFFPYGVTGAGELPEAGDDCEVWPVSVAKTTREWSAGNDPARFVTTFTITDVPALYAEVEA